MTIEVTFHQCDLEPVSWKSRNFSGDIILFILSKWMHPQAWNFAAILILIPFTMYEKTSFTEQVGRSFTNGFLCLKIFRDFLETGLCVQIQIILTPK